MKEYDETLAIKRMNKAVGADYADDEVLNVIDMIWDYYEQNGMLDPSLGDDDASTELADIVEYVTRMVKKDRRSQIQPEHIEGLVAAELAYEAELADFD
ncbi:MAG: hypothetical protein J6C77_04530 [Muribaculaceae bacterium]|nr:hypothetical protein [Muribaculaceae bacterium]